MAITLAKTPRPFTVLAQDDQIIGVMPTPTDERATEELFVTVFAHCLQTYEVTAIDRFDAAAQVPAHH
ncbi:hypothetical protein ACFW5V_32390 [Streptomyces sp. NPDC058762]|uniref:hypothetical protein n=1 Tax=Streptomyces sp. NPDC058762 TaxID=3346629 RepID=UPI0036B2089D